MLRHVQHCNVNCRDLSASVAFYESLGLTPLVRTNPAPQDGTGFGMAGKVQWDAWMMSDGRANPVIDLLEWTTPRPVGEPHGPGAGRGFTALRLATPTVDAPTVVTDPDGTTLELEPGPSTRLLGVVVGVADPPTSERWYREVLGLAAAPRGWSVIDDDFVIEFRPARGSAYAEAHHLGIYRMAFLVDDATAAAAAIRARGGTCPEPVWLDMGPTIPIDGLRAAFFDDPDGACLELIEAPTPS